jgi:dihydrofolate synthase/folylpolyglutamate synthase
VLFDGAHNPDGIRALSAALDELVGSRPLVLVASILSDKDPAAMLSGLLGRCRAAVLTEAANPRALPATDVLAAAPRGSCELHTEPDPRRALERARALAGPDGAVLVTGSLHLVGDLLADPGRRVVSAR